MTLNELKALPVGTIIVQDGVEEGEIIQAGRECHIIWPESGFTSIIYTDSQAWEKLVAALEVGA